MHTLTPLRRANMSKLRIPFICQTKRRIPASTVLDAFGIDDATRVLVFKNIQSPNQSTKSFLMVTIKITTYKK